MRVNLNSGVSENHFDKIVKISYCCGLLATLQQLSIQHRDDEDRNTQLKPVGMDSYFV